MSDVEIFRGKKISISITNPNKIEKGVSRVILNGETLLKNFVPADKLIKDNYIEVVMG